MAEASLSENPTGGWIQGFGENFQNQSDARQLAFDELSLDVDRVGYFQRYLDEYYNSEFIYGQGTEHILAMGERHAVGGNWLDIGSGTSALFWATAFRGIKAATCVDLVPEALYVFDKFRKSLAVPKCYEEALKIANNSIEQFSQLRKVPWVYHQCNVLQPWARCFAGQNIDMITAYAVFGLAKDANGYRDCFKHLHEASKNSKIVLGADWVRSDSFVNFEGHDNRYVSKELCMAAAKSAGFSIIECEYFGIAGDPLYSGVVSWVVR